MGIPFVTLKLDKNYELRMGMKTTIIFEQTTGRKLMDVAKDMELGSVSMVDVAQLLHAMIGQINPELTFEDVCDLVDENSNELSYIIEKVLEIINAGFGLDEDDPNAQTPTEKK